MDDARDERSDATASDELARVDAQMLVDAYAQGLFPMATPPHGPIRWYRGDPRGILPLDGLKVAPSLARAVRSERFEIRIDTSIEAVMRACAGDRGRDVDGRPESPGWMSEALLQAYLDLAQHGHVHSVEAWRDDRLVGGLYGVRLRAAFFGESMFCRPELGGTDASKVCLVHLVDRLRRGGFLLLDTQMVTDHMRRLGAIEISDAEYDERLAAALSRPARWGCVTSAPR